MHHKKIMIIMINKRKEKTKQKTKTKNIITDTYHTWRISSITFPKSMME